MKFKKYQHIERFGTDEVEGEELGTCFVFSKIDGCFPYRTPVMLEDGNTMEIGKIVNQNLNVKVLTYNFETKKIEPKKVIKGYKYNFDKNKADTEWVEFTVDRNRWKLISDQCRNSIVRTTINHKIFVINNNKIIEKYAKDLVVGDYVISPTMALDKLQRQIMLGGLLGDSSAFPNKKDKNNGIYFSHGIKQKEYINYKLNFFGKNAVLEEHVDGYVKDGQRYRGSSFINDATNEIYNMCYSDEKKEVTKEWLNNLNSFGIAIWYMDDGNLRNKKHAIFSIEGFSKKEQDLICEFMNQRGYTCNLQRAGEYNILRLDVRGSDNLFTDISSHIIPAMQYKLPEQFRNRYIEIKKDFEGSKVIVPRKILKINKGISSYASFNEMNYKYDIEIEDNHNYFCNGILVHNSNAQCYLNDDGELRCGSRNRELTLDNDNAGFYANMLEQKNILDYLNKHPTHRLYGEWLVPHSLRTYRDDAWRKFYVFDVALDNNEMQEGLEYIPYDIYQPMLEEFNIDYIPPLRIIKNGDIDKFIYCTTINDFLIQDGEGCGEGIVIKNYDYYNKYGRQTWAKIVTSEFKEKHTKEMGAPILGGALVEEKIIDKYITTAFVEKEFEKIREEKDGWSSTYIPMLLSRVFYELINEESWHMLKEFKNPTINYKTLNSLCISKVKYIKKDIFN